MKWFLGIWLCGFLLIGSGERVKGETFEGENTVYNTSMRLTFEGTHIVWEVNGQRIAPIKHETIQSTFPHARPLLCLYSMTTHTNISYVVCCIQPAAQWGRRNLVACTHIIMPVGKMMLRQHVSKNFQLNSVSMEVRINKGITPCQ